jgi:hypothetical protein
MIYQLILFQFIAHLLADFIFQPHGWTLSKSSKIISWHHIYHVIVVFLFSWLLSFDFSFWKAALMLTLLHFITDVLKSYLQIRSRKLKEGKNYFFADQFVHLVILLSISIIYFQNYEFKPVYELPLKHILIIAGFIFCAKPANIIIKNIFIAFSIETPHPNFYENSNEAVNEEITLPNAGKLIGIMERFLVLSLVLIGQYSAVGLIIAAKSILRYKSTQKNEYILVGTLLSFGIAVLLGILISNAFIHTI